MRLCANFHAGPSKEYLIFFLFSDEFRVLLFQVSSFCVPDSSRDDQVYKLNSKIFKVELDSFK